MHPLKYLFSLSFVDVTAHRTNIIQKLVHLAYPWLRVYIHWSIKNEFWFFRVHLSVRTYFVHVVYLSCAYNNITWFNFLGYTFYNNIIMFSYTQWLWALIWVFKYTHFLTIITDKRENYRTILHEDSVQ